MSKQDKAPEQAPENPKSCGASVAQHGESIFFAATMYGGAGYECPETYLGYLAAVAALIHLNGGRVPVITDAQRAEVAEAGQAIAQTIREVEAQQEAQDRARQAGAPPDFAAFALDPTKKPN